VLIDGQPLKRGEIQFISAAGRPSIGRLDQEGRFRLSCYEENDGALVGSHKVTITAAEGLGPTQTRWFAPKKYSDYRTSGLTEEITGPTEDLIINITWDGGHEFIETEGAMATENEGMQGRRGQKSQPVE
jgi:hypothetical protein